MPKKKITKTAVKSASKVESKTEVQKSEYQLIAELEKRIARLESQKAESVALTSLEEVSPEIKVKKLDKNAKLPARAHDTDAGLDIFALEDFEIDPLERKRVKTGIAMAIPDGYDGEIEEKSGIAAKKGIIRLGGVVDSSYRGEVLINLYNPESYYMDGSKQIINQTAKFKAGDKIAQIVLKKILLGNVVEVDELEDTERGEMGHGSTGS